MLVLCFHTLLVGCVVLSRVNHHAMALFSERMVIRMSCRAIKYDTRMARAPKASKKSALVRLEILRPNERATSLVKPFGVYATDSTETNSLLAFLSYRRKWTEEAVGRPMFMPNLSVSSSVYEPATPRQVSPFECAEHHRLFENARR